jgi:hypothetical protein
METWVTVSAKGPGLLLTVFGGNVYPLSLSSSLSLCPVPTCPQPRFTTNNVVSL